MTTPPRRLRHLDALDGVRGAAALAVVVTHVAFQTGQVGSGPLGAVQARLDSGVAVFFALSGFLLVGPWLNGQSQPTRRYLLRRAARVVPAYWLALIAALAVDSPDAVTATAHVWFGQVYVGHLLDDFSQTWSLSAEVAFYLLLPLLAPALARLAPARQLRILGAVAVLGLVCTWLVRADLGLPARAGFWLPVHLAWFAAGMALAVAARGNLPRVTRWLDRCARTPGLVWSCAGVLMLFASTPIAGPLTIAAGGADEAIAKELLYAVLALLVLAPFVTTTDVPVTGLRAVLTSRVARWLGTISYGIFLWHLIVLHYVFKLTGWIEFDAREVPTLVLTLAGTVVVAAASWYAIESPILGWAHRLTSRRPSADEPAAPRSR